MRRITFLLALTLSLVSFQPVLAADPTAPATDAEALEADIMDQPLDGSSIEAFEAGLERVREQQGEAAHFRVKQAVDYLLIYDLAAKRDRATLYGRLDGMSPNEIVAHAQR